VKSFTGQDSGLERKSATSLKLWLVLDFRLFKIFKLFNLKPQTQQCTTYNSYSLQLVAVERENGTAWFENK
jgi:hypothetical protein